MGCGGVIQGARDRRVVAQGNWASLTRRAIQWPRRMPAYARKWYHNMAPFLRGLAMERYYGGSLSTSTAREAIAGAANIGYQQIGLVLRPGPRPFLPRSGHPNHAKDQVRRTTARRHGMRLRFYREAPAFQECVAFGILPPCKASRGLATLSGCRRRAITTGRTARRESQADYIHVSYRTHSTPLCF